MNHVNGIVCELGHYKGTSFVLKFVPGRLCWRKHVPAVARPGSQKFCLLDQQSYDTDNNTEAGRGNKGRRQNSSRTNQPMIRRQRPSLPANWRFLHTITGFSQGTGLSCPSCVAMPWSLQWSRDLRNFRRQLSRETLSGIDLPGLGGNTVLIAAFAS